METIKKTDDDLKKIVEKWQPRLGLLDWDINIRFVDTRALEGGFASTQLSTSLQRAFITVLDIEDRSKSSKENDIELDTVHELLHVRLWLQDSIIEQRNNNYESVIREQSIEHIARALIIADRQNNTL